MIKLKPLVLTFRDDKFEKLFIESTSSRTRFQGQVAILIGMFVYLLCGILDQWFVPSEVSQQVWNTRFAALSVPILVLIISLSPIFKHLSYILLAFVGLAAGAGLIAMQIWIPIESTPYYYPMMIVVTFYTYNFIGTRFIYALFVDIFLLISYNIVFGIIMDYPFQILIAHDIFIISANLIGGVAGYLTEWQRRILFLREQELEKERKLHLHRALHDSLTGLPNRDLLYDRIEQSIATADRNKSTHSLFFLDLDGFKAINDNLGHKRGDSVLKEVAQRLNSVFREIDTVARIGGDEFCILASNVTTEEEAAEMANKILSLLNQPISGIPSNLPLSASIGICLFPYEGVNTVDIIQKADEAMYAVKAKGKSGFLFARPT